MPPKKVPTTSAKKTTKKTTNKVVSPSPPAVDSTPQDKPQQSQAQQPSQGQSKPKTPKVHRPFEDLMGECVKQAQDCVLTTRTLVSKIREAKKAHDREMRESQKNTKRSRKNSGNSTSRPLTGFAKPCRISDTLADFLHDVADNSDIQRGMEISRTEVTKRLNEYFVKNDLRDINDKRTILFEKDPKLVALFPSMCLIIFSVLSKLVTNGISYWWQHPRIPVAHSIISFIIPSRFSSLRSLSIFQLECKPKNKAMVATKNEAITPIIVH